MAEEIPVISVRAPLKAIKNNFYFYFFAALFVALAAFGFLSNRLFEAATGKAPSIFAARPRALDSRLTPLFPAEAVRSNVRSPIEAKRKGLFWAKLGGVAQVAIDHRLYPELIAQLYPGYPPNLANDAELWKKYFSYDFHTSIWLPVPPPVPYEGVSVYTAPFGCIEIFRRYGADILILGNSETMTSLIPHSLHESLGGKDEVLMCALPGSLPRSNQLSAEALAKTGKRARWAIWGYSFWSAYTASPLAGEWNRMHQGMHLDLSLSAHEASGAKKIWRFVKSVRLAQLFPALTWENIFPPSFAALREAEAAAAKEAKEAKGNISRSQIFQTNVIAATVAESSEPPTFLKDISKRDCDLGQARSEFAAALAAILNVADRVLVYLPPVTPHLSGFGPPCFLQNVREMVRAAARDPRVVVMAEDWNKFQLNYGDFLYLTEKREPNGEDYFYRADPAHMNYEGGRKVTARIAEKIRN